MLKGHYSEVTEEKPAMADAQATIRWLITPGQGAPNFAMRVIEMKRKGERIPLHSHDYEHEVFVLSGSGRLESEQGTTSMTPGDFALVLPGEQHAFENTAEEPFRFICVIPNQKPSRPARPGAR